MNKEVKKYTYLNIPLDYICVYNKLAYCLYISGVDIIKDCNASCKPINKDVYSYWNLFQLAVKHYRLNEKDKAEYYINYIKANINRIYNDLITDSNYKGSNNYFIDETGNKQTCIICNGWKYTMPNYKTSYKFVLNGGNSINDDGKGKKITIDITSTRTIVGDSEEVTEDMPYIHQYDNPDDSTWIEYYAYNKNIIIKPNSDNKRVGKITFIQSESGNKINITITQNKDTTEYKYYFEYEPKSFNFDRIGGSEQLIVSRCSKQKVEHGSPVGEDIAVDWNASINAYGFKYDPFSRQLTAENNNYKARSGKLVINRPELGSGANIEIPVTQQAGEMTTIYNLQAVVNNPIVPAVNGKVTITVVSNKQNYYGNEAVGEPEPVQFNITSARGYLNGVSNNGAVWSMSENISEVSREDTLIVTQEAAEGKEIRIKITQQPAVVDYIYEFRTTTDAIRFDATGGNKTINVISTKQKTINGKPYGDATGINYTSKLNNSNFSINNNIINATENAEADTKEAIATFTQNESNKVFNINVIQNAASESYTYTLTISTNEGIAPTQVNLNRSANSIDYIIESKKQRLVNNKPSGGLLEVGVKLVVTGEGYSVSGNALKVSENKTTVQRLGTLTFIQEESGKQYVISYIQAAGASEWRYTFEITETEINVPSYKTNGYTTNFNIKSYKRLYINDVYQDKEANVTYNVTSNQPWCKVNNNSTLVTYEENLTNLRIATIKIVQSETNKEHSIVFKQSGFTKVTKTIIGAEKIVFHDINMWENCEWVVQSYDLINGHKKENIENGIIQSVSIEGSINANYFSINKKSNADRTVQGVYHGPIGQSMSCGYIVNTTKGTGRSIMMYDANRYRAKDVGFSTVPLKLVDDIYLLIDEYFVGIYQKLLALIVDNHESILKAPININNKQILDCWNLFQSSVAAYNLGFEKQARFFINFIDCNINRIIEKFGDSYLTQFYLKHPDMFGILGVVRVSDINFYVNDEDGNIYQKIDEK